MKIVVLWKILDSSMNWPAAGGDQSRAENGSSISRISGPRPKGPPDPPAASRRPDSSSAAPQPSRPTRSSRRRPPCAASPGPRRAACAHAHCLTPSGAAAAPCAGTPCRSFLCLRMRRNPPCSALTSRSWIMIESRRSDQPVDVADHGRRLLPDRPMTQKISPRPTWNDTSATPITRSRCAGTARPVDVLGLGPAPTSLR